MSLQLSFQPGDMFSVKVKNGLWMIVCYNLGVDKENLDRSDASINLGFESPTGKFVSGVAITGHSHVNLLVFAAQKMNPMTSF